MVDENLTSDQTGFDAAGTDEQTKQVVQASEQQVHVPGGRTAPVEGNTEVPDVPYEGEPETVNQGKPPANAVGPEIEVQTQPQGLGGGVTLASEEPVEADEPETLQLLESPVPTADPIITETVDEGVAPAIEPEPEPEPDPEPQLEFSLDDPQLVTPDAGTPDGSAPVAVGDNTDQSPVSVTTRVATPVPGQLDFDLNLTSGSPITIRDSLTGQTVQLRIDRVDGEDVVVGFIGSGANETTVFTVSGNELDGTITLTQFRSVLHGDPQTDPNTNDRVGLFGQNPDNETPPAGSERIVLVGTLTQADGQSVTQEIDITNAIVFTDDEPEVNVEGSDIEGLFVTYDGNTSLDGNFQGSSNGDVPAAGTDSDSVVIPAASIEAAFVSSVDYNADGPAASDISPTGEPSPVVSDYQLVLFEDIVSGVTPVRDDDGSIWRSQGEEVIWFEVLGVNGDLLKVEGRIDLAGEQIVVFDVVINSDPAEPDVFGDLVFTQYEQLDHLVPTSSDYTSDERTLGNNQLFVEQQITATDADFDTDTATARIDLGNNLIVGDDGPAIGDLGEVDLSQITLVTSDAAAAGGNYTGGFSASADADFDAAFEAVVSAAVLAGEIDFGADIGGTETADVSNYKLELGDLVGAGGVTGLTSEHPGTEGDPIYVFLNAAGTQLVGSTNAGYDIAVDGIDGTVAFTVDLTGVNDVGNVELTQYQAVTQPVAQTDPAAPNDPITGYPSDEVTLDGLVKLSGTVTATDSDGDKATTTLSTDIGDSLELRDDGPAIGDLGEVDLSQITLVTSDAAAAGGNYTGGFSASADADFDAAFEAVVSAAVLAGEIDFGADIGGTETADVSNYKLELGDLVGAGGVTGLTSEHPGTEGDPIYVFLNAAGTQLVGSTNAGYDIAVDGIDGTVAFTVDLTGVNDVGNVELTQYQAVTQPVAQTDPAAPNDPITGYPSDEVTLDGLVKLSGTVTATDSDGDKATTTLSTDIGDSLELRDDGPAIGDLGEVDLSQITLVTSDAAAAGGNYTGGFSASADADFDAAFEAVVSAAVLAGEIDFGADIGGTETADVSNYKLELGDLVGAGGVTGLTSEHPGTEGDPIYVFLNAAGTQLVGSTNAGYDIAVDGIDGTVAFTVDLTGVNDVGNVELTQYQAVTQPVAQTDPAAPNDPITGYPSDEVTLDGLVKLSGTVTATDSDGDKATTTLSTDIGDSLELRDDGPAIGDLGEVDLSQITLVTSDAAAAGGNYTGGFSASADADFDAAFEAVVSAAVLAGEIDFGADIGGTETADVSNYKLELGDLVGAGGVTGLTSEHPGTEGDPIYVFLNAAGTQLVGSTNAGYDIAVDGIDGTVAFTVDLTGVNDVGNVELTQYQAVTQPVAQTDPAAPNDPITGYPSDEVTLDGLVKLSGTVTATDSDGDKATTTLSTDIGDSLELRDDGPAIGDLGEVDLSQITLVTSDAAAAGGNYTGGFSASADADFDAAFEAVVSAAVLAGEIDFGADIGGTETADVSNYKLELGDLVGAGGVTGLTSEHPGTEGDPIYVFLNAAGTQLVGSTNAGYDIAVDGIDGTVAFTVDLTGVNDVGNVELTQYQAVTQPVAQTDPAAPNDPITGYPSDEVTLDGLVKLSGTVTATDSDGDKATTTLSTDIGDSLELRDDGPAIGDLGEVDLSQITLVTSDAAAAGGNYTGGFSASADADFDAAFEAVVSAAVLAGEIDFGADIGGTETADVSNYKLELGDLVGAGGVTGLTSEHPGTEGDPIYVFLNAAGTQLVGSTNAGYDIAVDGIDGTVAFTVDLTGVNDVGNVELTQYQAVTQPVAQTDPAAPNDPITGYPSDEVTLDGLVKLSGTVTATDSDGDKATTTLSTDIGDSLELRDDGPAIGDLGEVDLSQITLVTSDAAAAGGNYTGGFSASADADFDAAFEAVVSAAVLAGEIDFGADIGGTETADVSNYKLELGDLVGAGGVTGLTSEHPGTEGDPIYVFLNAAGTQLVGSTNAGYDIAVDGIDGTVAFTVDLTGVNDVGNVELTQYQAVTQPVAQTDPAAPNDPITGYPSDEVTLDGLVKLSGTVTATDSDGDKATTTLSTDIGDSLELRDDGPAIGDLGEVDLSQITLVTSDAAAAGGNYTGGFSASADADFDAAFEAVVSAAVLAGEIDFGADIGGTETADVSNYKLELGDLVGAGGVTGLTSEHPGTEGDPIYVFLNAAGTQLVGSTNAGYDIAVDGIDGTVAFTVDLTGVNDVGNVELTQYQAVTQPVAQTDPAAPNDPITGYPSDEVTLDGLVKLSGTVTATDSDGDKATTTLSTDIGDSLELRDDGPAIGDLGEVDLSQITLVTSDAAAAGGNYTGGFSASADADFDAAFEAVVSAAVLAGEIDFGADIGGTETADVSNYKLELGDLVGAGGVTGLTSEHPGTEGDPIYVFLNAAGTQLVGSTNAGYDIAVDGIDGTVAFTVDLTGVNDVGNVELTQYQAVTQPVAQTDPAAPNDPITGYPSDEVTLDGLVKLSGTVTATDSDGDKATTTLSTDIGDSLELRDDGPAIGDLGEVDLSQITLVTSDAAAAGGNYTGGFSASADADFDAAFEAVVSAAVLAGEIDFGADIGGTETADVSNYKLELGDLVGAGGVTGLTSEHPGTEGDPIYVFLNAAGTQLVGSTNAGYDIAVDGIDGTVAFTVDLTGVNDVGNVELTQYQAVTQPVAQTDPAAPNDPITGYPSDEVTLDGLVKLSGTVTATDSDGDKATTTLSTDIGDSLELRDDGPAIGDLGEVDLSQITLVTSDAAAAGGNYTGGFSASADADFDAAFEAVVSAAVLAGEIDFGADIGGTETADVSNYKLELGDLVGAGGVTGLTSEHPGTEGDPIYVFLNAAGTQLVGSTNAGYDIAVDGIDGTVAFTVDLTGVNDVGNVELTQYQAVTQPVAQTDPAAPNDPITGYPSDEVTLDGLVKLSGTVTATDSDGDKATTTLSTDIGDSLELRDDGPAIGDLGEVDLSQITLVTSDAAAAGGNYTGGFSASADADFDAAFEAVVSAAVLAGEIDFGADIGGTETADVSNYKLELGDLVGAGGVTGLTSEHPGTEGDPIYVFLNAAGTQLVGSTNAGYDIAVDGIDGTVAFTVDLTGVNDVGNVELTQYQAVTQPVAQTDPAAPNDPITGYPSDEVTLDGLVKLSGTVTATDSDGDKATTTLSTDIGDSLELRDDGPAIGDLGEVDLSQITLVTSDAAAAGGNYTGGFSASADADFDAAFEAVVSAAVLAGEIDFGADIGGTETADVSNYKLELGDLVGAGGVTGLTSEHPGTEGDPIYVFLNAAGTQLVGSTNAGYDIAVDGIDGTVAFTVDLTGVNDVGNVELTQYQAVTQPVAQTDPAAPNDPITGYPSDEVTLDGLVKLSGTVTATDSDGDKATTTLSTDIGDSLELRDDGPAIGDLGEVDLSQITLVTSDAAAAGGNYTGGFSASADADFDAAFEAVVSAAVLAGEIDFGADIGGTETADVSNYKLELGDLVGAGGVTGLTSEHPGTEGDPIYVFLNAAGTQLVGSTNAGYDIAVDGIDGTVAFTVDLTGVNDVGNVELTQYQAVTQPVAQTDPAAPNDPITGYPSDEVTLDGLVKLSGTVTATDSDGDKATTTLSTDIGDSLELRDDGPAIGDLGEVDLSQITLVTSDAAAAGGNYTGGFSASADADFDAAFEAVVSAAVLAGEIDFGADIGGTETADVSNYKLELGDLVGAGGVTGLTSEHPGTEGDPIYVFLNAAGTQLVGSTNAGYDIAVDGIDGTVAFTVDLTGVNDVGNVELTQYQAVTQPVAQTDPAAPNDPITGYPSDEVTLDGLVKLSGTVTATDSDGDKATTTLSTDIGDSLELRDDGPAIGDLGEVDLSQITLVTSDAAAAGGNYTGGFSASADADFDAAFEAVVSAVVLAGEIDFGADIGGTETADVSNYKLELGDLVGAGGVTGLTSEHPGTEGDPIYVFLNAAGTQLVGSTNAGYDIAVDGIDGTVAFTVDLTGVNDVGNVELTQYQAVTQPVAQTDPAAPNDPITGYPSDEVTLDGLVKLSGTVTATDSDGDKATTTLSTDIGDSLELRDDGPAITNQDGTSTTNLNLAYVTTPTNQTLDLLQWDFGADNGGDVYLTTNDGFVPISVSTSTDGFSIDTDSVAYDPVSGVYGFNVIYDETGEVITSYSLNPDSGVNDAVIWYQVPGETTFIDVPGSASQGGNTDFLSSDIQDGDDTFTIITVASRDSSQTDFSATVYTDPVWVENEDTVNGSTSGWGAGSNNFTAGSSISFLFYQEGTATVSIVPNFAPLTDDTLQVTGNDYLVDGFAISLESVTGSAAYSLTVKVNYVTTDGITDFNQYTEYVFTNVIPSLPGSQSYIAVLTAEGVSIYGETDYNANGDSATVIVSQAAPALDPGETFLGISSVSYFNNDPEGNQYKLNRPNILTENVDRPDLSYQLDFEITDGDFDNSTFTMSVLMDGNDAGDVVTSASYVAPVAIDLDGDGMVSYQSDFNLNVLDSSIVYAAFVAPVDGLLAYDYNQDGILDESREINFMMWGDDPSVLTDVQALAAYFDSNGDGVLDSNDSTFADFGVWSDLNLDGQQQEGEFYGLNELGIESISLEYSYDSSALQSSADGGVIVYGQVEVEYEDGSTGLAEDVAFAVQSSPDELASAQEGDPTTEDAMSSSPLIDELVSGYLDTMQASGDTDGDGHVSQVELAYGLDEAVSNFLDSNGLSADEFHSIQQEVFNELADQLSDLDTDASIGSVADAAGDADAASVLAALESNLDDLVVANHLEHDDYSSEASAMV